MIGNWHGYATSFASAPGKVAAKSRRQIDRRVRGRGCPPHVIHRSLYVDFSLHDYLPAIGSRPRRWHCWRAASRFLASLKLRRCLGSPRDGSTSADAGNFSRFWSPYRRRERGGGEGKARSTAVIIAVERGLSRSVTFQCTWDLRDKKSWEADGGERMRVPCREQNCRDESELQDAPEVPRFLLLLISYSRWARWIAQSS